MKMFATLCLIITAFSSFKAQAAVQEVLDPNLYLIGSSVQNNKYPFRLALACVEGVSDETATMESCKAVRFVAFTDSRRAYFVGKSYEIKSMDDAKTLYKNLLRQTKSEKDSKTAAGILIFTGGFGGGVLLSVSLASVAPAAVILGVYFGKLTLDGIRGRYTKDSAAKFFNGVTTVVSSPLTVVQKREGRVFMRTTLGKDGWENLQNPTILKKKFLKRLIKHLDATALDQLSNMKAGE